MSNLVQTEANALLAASSGQAAYTAPTPPILVALCTATGTATAPGTEVTGGSYVRVAITFSAPSGGTITNSNALIFNSMPGCVVTGIDEYDSAGVRRWFGNLTATKTVNPGDTFSIGAGSFNKQLS